MTSQPTRVSTRSRAWTTSIIAAVNNETVAANWARRSSSARYQRVKTRTAAATSATTAATAAVDGPEPSLQRHLDVADVERFAQVDGALSAGRRDGHPHDGHDDRHERGAGGDECSERRCAAERERDDGGEDGNPDEQVGHPECATHAPSPPG